MNLGMAVMKVPGGFMKCIVTQDHPQLIVNGFVKAGIPQAIDEASEMPDDDSSDPSDEVPASDELDISSVEYDEVLDSLDIYYR